MRKITRLFMTALMAVGLALTTVPNAQADAAAQPIDCFAHVLDATDAQSIDWVLVQQYLDDLKTIAPTADVYLQVYQQLPGGDASGFWQKATVEGTCANWLAPSGDRPNDNLLVMVYGVESGSFGLFYGYGFGASLHQYHNDILPNVAGEFAQSADTHGNTDYLTSGMLQTLINAKFFMKISPYYSSSDGIYHMPVYKAPNDGTSHDTSDTLKAAGVAVLLVLALGLIVALVAKLLWRFLLADLMSSKDE